jgi:hypothetical protein
MSLLQNVNKINDEWGGRISRLVPSPVTLDEFELSIQILCSYCASSETYMIHTTSREMDLYPSSGDGCHYIDIFYDYNKLFS